MLKSNILAAAAVLTVSSLAHAEDAKTLQRELESKYPLTVINAEGETVSQGVVLRLKKGLTGGVTKCANDYKDGKISLGGNVLLRANCARLGAAATATARGFVPGEVMSLLRIEVKDGITFEMISDPIYDIRFRADLKFAVPKGANIDLAQADQMINDAFSVIGAGGNPQQGNPNYQSSQAAPPPPPPTPATSTSVLQPIAPPPPPPDAPAGAAPPPPPPPDQPVAQQRSQQQPQTLKLGLSIDQVVSILGPPATIADLGSKKIYTYRNPTMKVTFTDGKVTDMQ